MPEEIAAQKSLEFTVIGSNIYWGTKELQLYKLAW